MSWLQYSLTGFTRLVTSQVCGTFDTYHRFEVPKEGDIEKPIIFHASRDMDRRRKRDGEDGAITSSVIPEERYYSKGKMMCQGKETKPCRLKNHGRITPCEATLSIGELLTREHRFTKTGKD